MSNKVFHALKGAEKDFETELPLVPNGHFTSFSPYAKHSKQPAQVRDLPVLQATFDASRFDMRGAHTYSGFGAVQFDGIVALAFRIQSGPDALYWLANPADRDVWTVLDQWIAAERMVLAAEFGEQVLLVASDFFEPPPMKMMRQAVQAAKTVTPGWVAAVSKAILTDGLIRFVSSDLAKFPKLRNVQARMVQTSITGGVAVMTGNEELHDLSATRH